MSDYNPLNPLDMTTEAALKASIVRFGVVCPVIKDQNGIILDGHHRVRLAEELGQTYEVVVHEVATEDLEDFLLSLNDDRRPRTTPEQRREMSVALREEGHSYRAIAGALGVHKRTIERDLEATGAYAPVAEPERITGLDGKSRPAKQPRRGHRANPMVRFEAVTERQQQVANGQKRRLVDGLSEVNGLCRGLEALDFGMIAAACNEGEIVMWSKKARALSRALFSISTKLSEVKGGS